MRRVQLTGLGELLRYVSELVELGADEHYQQMGVNYRARYTPVLRAIRSVPDPFNAGATTTLTTTARIDRCNRVRLLRRPRVTRHRRCAARDGSYARATRRTR